MGAGLVVLIEVFAVLLCTSFWLFVHWKKNKLEALKPAALPVILFFVFGTIDALFTISGTLGNPLREANPFARAFLEAGGWAGYGLLTMLWISLWALVALGLHQTGNRWPEREKACVFLLRFEFWCLAFGHFAGAFSWVRDYSGALGTAYANYASFYAWEASVLGASVIFARGLNIFLFGLVLTIIHTLILGRGKNHYS